MKLMETHDPNVDEQIARLRDERAVGNNRSMETLLD